MKPTWVVKQHWKSLLFAHWPVSADSLRPLVPDVLELDTYDGQAWIGIIPFELNLIRLRFLPVIPYTVPFPEVNVRTYVKVNGKPAVFFITLDASNPFSLQAARLWYHLPYYRAKMSLNLREDSVSFQSERMNAGHPAVFSATYGPTSPPFFSKKGSIEYWLTERYVFACRCPRSQRVYWGEIHHDPWELQQAYVEIAANTLTDGYRLSLSKAPALVHYSRGTEAFIWRCRRHF
jgi:uncharacterized protein YqjF (DUF2071 family)